MSQTFAPDNYKDLWRFELRRIRDSFEIYKMGLPSECVYELHHAIMHIAIGHLYGMSERAKNIIQACDHVRRAHLDYLKILITHIHNINVSQSGNNNTLIFLKARIATRLTELAEVGSQHVSTVDNFRKLIADHYPKNLPPLSTPLEHTDLFAGSNSKTNRLPSANQRKLLWQWAFFETILISLLGKRPYNISFELWDSYIKFDDLEASLKEQIAVLQYSIMCLARRYDHTGNLEAKLKNIPGYGVYINAIDTLLNGGRNNSKKVPGYLIDNIGKLNEIFVIVADFLDLSPQQLQENNPFV